MNENQDAVSQEPPSNVITLADFKFSRIPKGGIALEIPCDQLLPDPNQPRKKFRQKALLELASSIESEGLQQYPVVNFWKEVGGKLIFVIKAGERRWRAHQILNRETMMCIVMPDHYVQAQDIDRTLAQAAENSSREAHTVSEIVAVTRDTVANVAMKKLAKTGNTWGAIDVGLGKVDKAFGKQPGWARQYFTLSQLDPDLLALLDEEDDSKRINLNVGVALARAPKDVQKTIFEESKVHFRRSHAQGFAFIVATVRGVRLNRGERIRGRAFEHKKSLMKLAARMTSSFEQFGGGRGVHDREAWINDILSTMSADEMNLMLNDLVSSIRLLEMLKKQVEAKHEKKYDRSNGLQSVWGSKKTGT